MENDFRIKKLIEKEEIELHDKSAIMTKFASFLSKPF